MGAQKSVPGNPITPAGYAALRARYDHLLGTERPEIVEIVSWAAGNGDRSENGDYLYGRKRMREIDRELGHLSRRMKAARVIDPAEQPDNRAPSSAPPSRSRTRTMSKDRHPGRRRRAGCQCRTDRLVPLARALKGASVGDLRLVRLPGGDREWEVVAIDYAAERSP